MADQPHLLDVIGAACADYAAGSVSFEEAYDFLLTMAGMDPHDAVAALKEALPCPLH